MVFSSLLFLFAYLPVTLFLYYLIPNMKYRNWVLFIVSLLFYGWGEPIYILVMLASILEAYVCGFFIAKHRETNVPRARFYLVLSLCLNLISLLFFKYCNFFIENLRLLPFLTDVLAPIEGLKLPIGISFYTFQIMSYTIDLYRGQTDVQRNFVAFGTYVTLFPQLIAGPIVRYRDVDDQLMLRRETVDLFGSGVRRFVVGLAKKVVIGDACAAYYEYFKATDAFADSTAGAWMVMIFYTLHIYYDFSGYSDMAIGLGRMIGFRFLENFNYPYISRSIVEFWKRWHISLTSWFREYVYFPLGGNRVSKPKWIRNTLIVWLITGIWHGAGWNFVMWGLYYAVFQLGERLIWGRLLEKLPVVLRHVYTVVVVLLGWALFAVESLDRLWVYVMTLFGGAAFFDSATAYYLISYLPMLVILTIAATPLGRNTWHKLSERTQNILTPVLMLAALVLCTASLVDASYNPFLYFRF